MARDVELIIRAKDAATKAIDSIKDALKDLTDVQTDVGRSAEKTDSLLGELGSQLKTLNSEAKGLAALGKVASEIDRAGAAVARLEADVRKGADEFGRLARETQSAATNSARLRGEVEAEKRALEENNSAKREASKELTKANQALRQAERNQERYNAALAKTPDTKQGSAQRSAGAFIQADVEGARSKQAALSQSVNEYAAAITESKNALKGLEPQVAAAAAQERKLSTETEKTANALGRQRTDLTTARTELSAISDAADEASKSFTGTSFNAEKVAQSSARMAAELARTKARIEGLNQASRAQPRASLSADTGDADKQRRALLELRREWVEAQADVKRLAQEMRSVTQPTEEMAAAFGRAQAAARVAKTQYEEQRAALRALAGSTQGSFAAFEQSAARIKTSAEIQAAALRETVVAGQGVARTLPPIAEQARRTGDGLDTAAGGGKRLREAFGFVQEGSRQSLSLFQRLRGEVLSLTGSFIGLYGAADQIGKILTAFQTLEGTQARLGVVFGGDTAKVGGELQFIAQQAQRLGIDFGTLSDQYSKFAVAANAANFSSETTRRVFLSVAEAGRVNRLSVDQMNGVFLALTQMISKGKVSAEELRGQLGERLTGAFNIFADAIGVTTAELDKMLEKGEVLATQSTFLKFADQLDKRFGGGLQEALKGTTAEIGRFSDNLLQAQVRIAEGGFIDKFTEGLRSLNDYFQSRDGRDFFLSLGAALGRLTAVLAEVPKYFDEIGLAIKLLIGYKLASYFNGVVSSIRATQGSVTGFAKSFYDFGGAVQVAGARVAAFAESERTFAGTVGLIRGQIIGASTAIGLFAGQSRVLSVTLTGLRGIMIAVAGTARIMWTAIGGLPGIVLTGITLALGAWVSKIDDSVQAIDEHKRIMGEVIKAYQDVRGETDEWAKGIKNVSLDQANTNVRQMRDELKKAKDDIAGFRFADFGSLQGLNRRDQGQFALAQQMNELKKAFLDGKKPARDFVAELENLYKQAKDDVVRKAAESLLGFGRSAADAERRTGEAAVVAKTLGSNLDGLDKDASDAGVSVKNLGGAAKDANSALNSVASEGAKEFATKLKEIRDLTPQIADEMKRLADIDALNRLYQDAVKVARTMGDVMNATKAYNDALNGINIKAFGGSGMEAAIKQIKGYEGFRADSYYDTNAFRVGYGSDTVTLADGSIKKVVDGIAITEADAMRDLVRRVGEFQEGVKKQIGSDRFGAFSSDQQGVLTSIAYNYGSLPDRIVDAIKTGNADTISKAIRGLGDDNGGINRGRRESEATTFAASGDTPRSAAILADNEEKKAAKAKEYNTELENRLSLQEQENANGGKLTEAAFVQKKLAEEENRAREAGVTLTDAQIERIKAQAAEEYKIANAKREDKTAQQEANTALQNAVALLAQRNQLQKEFNLAQKGGDVTRATELQTQLDGTNSKLTDAIAKAREMWTALGGPEADVALTKLDTLQQKANQATNQFTLFGLSTQQIGQLTGGFADGVVNAFDSFAQSVANGENAVKALGRAFLQFAADFLRQIATMILKQAVLNALQSFGFGIPGVGVGVGHTGGMVGSTGVGMGNMRRTVNPMVFANALRFHTGGMAGLRPDEVPIIAKKNEEIITEQDPRHRKNGGMQSGGGNGGGGDVALRNIVVLDEESATNWLGGSAGERVTISHIKRNAATIKRIIGG